MSGGHSHDMFKLLQLSYKLFIKQIRSLKLTEIKVR